MLVKTKAKKGQIPYKQSFKHSNDHDGAFSKTYGQNSLRAQDIKLDRRLIELKFIFLYPSKKDPLHFRLYMSDVSDWGTETIVCLKAHEKDLSDKRSSKSSRIVNRLIREKQNAQINEASRRLDLWLADTNRWPLRPLNQDDRE
ncbi:MAG: hypothetical protein Q4P66_09960 [Actinomycetaceae bacterium]|nr:hypothetical protein [Actinomycetaceae bacterium]